MSARQPDSPAKDDDAVLWQRVTALVKPSVYQARRYRGEIGLTESIESIESIGSTGLAASGVRAKGKKPTKSNIQKNGLPALSGQSVPSPIRPIDLRTGEKAGIDGGTQKRLFRGDVKIDARLDLHGHNAAQAQGKLTQFLLASNRAGYRCVLVITGKGVRGEGVLRGLVPDWLKHKPLSEIVLAIAQAKPGDGGTGALYVLLRRQRERS